MKTIDVIFIVDNSGSMSGLEKDTLGGFNAVLQQQKQLDVKDQVFVTTVLFNSQYRYLYQRKPINIGKKRAGENLPSLLIYH